MARRADYTSKDSRAQRAKKEGFAARSVYKLDEIDKRFRLIQRGDVVLDLGAAPGSWSQYAGQKVGSTGLVISVDRRPMGVSVPNGCVIQGNAFRLTFEEVDEASGGRAPPVDVVLSDMAPDTTGVPFADHVKSIALCERALEAAKDWLQPGGSFVCKVFQGEDEPAFRARVKQSFGKVKGFKPQGTRKNSVEIFLVATGFRAGAERDGE